VKLGETVRHQYYQNGNVGERLAGLVFCSACYGAGYCVSLFNSIDKEKRYCIGHVVVAQKVPEEEILA